MMDNGGVELCSTSTDGGLKVGEKLQSLNINNSGQPVQKKLKVVEGIKALPTHDCEKQQPEFSASSGDEERCCSCGKIAVGPYSSMTCGHIFGTEAVKALERESMVTFQCPGKDFDNERCQEILESAQLRPYPALHRSIQNKMVKCINVKQGCRSTMQYKSHKSHLDNDCPYTEVRCPNCTEYLRRCLLDDHKKNCRFRTCDFGKIGCGHVTSPLSQNSVSRPGSRQHNVGLHFAFILQNFLKGLAMAKVHSESIGSTLTECSKDWTGLMEILHMMNNSDQTINEAMTIEELRNIFVNSSVDTKNHLDTYDDLVKNRLAVQVAQQVFSTRARGQNLEKQEESASEDIQKLLKDTIEIPILLNQGCIIFKVTEFSKKRAKAVKGELKKGVYGPQFYTHEFGYLMVPILYPNGDGAGAGTHLSIFIAIKRGKYDAVLPWPIVGRVTISILSQKRVGHQAIRHSFKTDVASLSYHRPTLEMNQASGIPKALDLSLLKQPSDYLVDDTLFIQIVVDPKLPEG